MSVATSFGCLTRITSQQERGRAFVGMFPAWRDEGEGWSGHILYRIGKGTMTTAVWSLHQTTRILHTTVLPPISTKNYSNAGSCPLETLWKLELHLKRAHKHQASHARTKTHFCMCAKRSLWIAVTLPRALPGSTTGSSSSIYDIFATLDRAFSPPFCLSFPLYGMTRPQTLITPAYLLRTVLCYDSRCD